MNLLCEELKIIIYQNSVKNIILTFSNYKKHTSKFQG